MSRVRVSVVIPNWNGLHLLQACLAALDSQIFSDFEIIVVDNGSSDGSVPWLQRQSGQIRSIFLDKNTGFPAAVNRGIEASDAAYIVLLNNDTIPDKDWLKNLVDAMDKNLQATFGASRILLHQPPHLIDSAGDGFNIRFGGFNIGAGDTADSHSDACWVFGACAGAAIYRRELFEDIGLFDEDYFLVFEDVDLSLRAQLAGHRCQYIPNAVVYHHRGASTATASEEVLLRSWRNHIWVAAKNLPPLLLITWSLWFLIRCARLVVYTTLASRHQNVDVVPLGKYWQTLKNGLKGLNAARNANAPKRRLGSWALSQRFRNQPISPETNSVRGNA